MGWHGLTWQERYWQKVDQRGVDECWPWTAYINEDGYGRFNLYGKYGYTKLCMAQRIAYELTFGEITDQNLRVLHKCDNPPCCNPYHLFLGTQADNIKDMIQKGRHFKSVKPCKSHPDRKPHCRDMCAPCYRAWYRKSRKEACLQNSPIS